MTVKKTDLRLGNLFKQGVVCKINGRLGAKVHVCGRLEYKNGKLKNRTEVSVEDLEPIVLSPQVLVEWCGFRDKGGNIYVCDDYSLIWNGEYFVYGHLLKINILSQLQNLHKSLTEKELEIKE